MNQFQIAPAIHEYNTFIEFIDDVQLTKNDLILTNEYIYTPTISRYHLPCHIIFQEKYGQGEPTDIMVNKLLDQLIELEYKRIIAIGGGTVLDIAKVLAVSIPTAKTDELFVQMDSLQQQHELYLIPTTCGTGSEVTNISILNRTKLGIKQGLVSDSMYASHAILIPEFIATLPYKVFATSSIDALIHAVESYLSPESVPYSELFSVAAIRCILDGYQKIAQDKKQYTSLGIQFLRASNYAGIAFGNAGCGPIHAMSYALGGKYHVTHGESNYQFFLPILKYYKEAKPSGKIAELEKLLCECLESNDAFISLEHLLEQILAPKPMSAYGAVQEDIPIFAEGTFSTQQRLLSRSYVPLTKDSLTHLFQICLTN